MDPASLTYDQEAVNNIFLKGDTAFLTQGIPGIMAYAQDPSKSKVVNQIKVGLVPGGKAGVSAALTLPEAYAIPTGLEEQGGGMEVHRVHDQQGHQQEARPANRDPSHLVVPVHGQGPRQALPVLGRFLEADGKRKGTGRAHLVQQFVDVAITETQKMLSGKTTPQQTLNEMAGLLKDYAGKP